MLLKTAFLAIALFALTDSANVTNTCRVQCSGKYLWIRTVNIDGSDPSTNNATQTPGSGTATTIVDTVSPGSSTTTGTPSTNTPTDTPGPNSTQEVTVSTTTGTTVVGPGSTSTPEEPESTSPPVGPGSTTTPSVPVSTTPQAGPTVTQKENCDNSCPITGPSLQVMNRIVLLLQHTKEAKIAVLFRNAFLKKEGKVETAIRRIIGLETTYNFTMELETVTHGIGIIEISDTLKRYITEGYQFRDLFNDTSIKAEGSAKVNGGFLVASWAIALRGQITVNDSIYYSMPPRYVQGSTVVSGEIKVKGNYWPVFQPNSSGSHHTKHNGTPKSKQAKSKSKAASKQLKAKQLKYKSKSKSKQEKSKSKPKQQKSKQVKSKDAKKNVKSKGQKKD